MKISAYTTCRNAVGMLYPYEASIKSALKFADEVVVLNSTAEDDGTCDILEKLAEENDKLQIYNVEIDWNAKNAGIFDGITKSLSREQCSGDILVHFDLDEVFEEKFGEKLKTLLLRINSLSNPQAPIMTAPVIEYWGGPNKVRIDVNCWKERISRNIPELTHGIPKAFRLYKDGLLYSKPGSDGCNLIHSQTAEPAPLIHFINPQVEYMRQQAIYDKEQLPAYQFWFNAAIDELPSVFHFSWWNIADKIKRYRQFWNNSWLSLYGQKQDKPENWNPFFENKSLDEVTEEEIQAKAKELAEETGGHVFHEPYLPGVTKKTNWITLEQQTIPELVKDWCEKNRMK